MCAFCAERTLPDVDVRARVSLESKLKIIFHRLEFITCFRKQDRIYSMASHGISELGRGLIDSS